MAATSGAGETTPRKRRVLHANVLEDGLADTPASLWFTDDFRRSLDKVLAALSDDGNGRRLHSFQASRDATQLPPVGTLSSAEALFGFVDVVYSSMYHALGGEAKFRASTAVVQPDLRNSLRGVFLHSFLQKPQMSPAADNAWQLPRDFDEQVDKVVDGMAKDAREVMKERIERLVRSSFDSRTGTLVWDRNTVQDLVKRREDLGTKWQRTLTPCIQAVQADDSDDSTRSALSLLMRLRHGNESPNLSVSALIEITPLYTR
eukprot:TRINITY_DN45585_c0_g1_i1.p2 TRINITY_DN45585_c0_g1~~TRINITY_DN45585_c0_g1_i1.p2  ORF type:complete len:277 (+),score=35.98 TRINITY_DN45585_c0_g1_i1:49-831(+)